MDLLKVIIVFLLVAISGCMTSNRPITVNIYVYDEGVSNFTADVLAEITKQGELEKKIDTSIRGSFVPGAYGM